MNDEPRIVEPSRSIVDHATCLACGCLCDDIRVEVEAGRIVEAENACSIGRPWFLTPRPGEGHPVASIDGQAVELEQAIERAAEILDASKAPVIWGLNGTTIEAVRSALAIADRIGAVVDPAAPLFADASRLAAFRRVGLVSASLGEVKDRADVVVFWGTNPIRTHPRHWERYSVEPKGRFVPNGRADRIVIVVDVKPTETSQAADLFIQVDPGRQAEVFEALRALVKGIKIDPDRVERATGLSFAILEDLAARFLRAQYGAFFFGTGLDSGDLQPWTIEAAFRLVRDLNEGRRFVGMELGSPGNAAGASTVITWQAGAPRAIDFGLGHPRHLPGEATLLDRMALGTVDAVLIIADDPFDILPIDEAYAGLEHIPAILLRPGSTAGQIWPAVSFDVARTGIEAGGTVARIDGLMLPLRPALETGLPTDREVLDAILRRIDALN